MEIKKIYYIADSEHADSIYGSEYPVCIDLTEVERLALEWDMTTSQLLDMMHEADEGEITEYGLYDSSKSVVFQTGFILGQAVKAIEDRRESGSAILPLERVLRYPKLWLHTEKIWIDRYGLNYALLENMATRAQDILDAHGTAESDQYRAGANVGYMAAQITF